MKYLIIILLLTFSFNAFSKCLVINESKIENVIGFTPNGIVETCPKDLDNKDVTNIKDVSYTKSLLDICIDEDDCQLRREQLVCNDLGRPIKRLDLLEVYCTKPVFSSSKRAARLLEIKEAEDIQKEKDDDKKGDWTTFCAAAKVGIEMLVCQDKGFL